jgi:hypothetical protein
MAKPSERVETERASRIKEAGDERSGAVRVDIARRSVYLAIVPWRNSTAKQPPIRRFPRRKNSMRRGATALDLDFYA